MVKKAIFLVVILCFIVSFQESFGKEIIKQQYPVGKPGLTLVYGAISTDLPKSVVKNLELIVGEVEEINDIQYQWIQLNSEKENGQSFSIIFLTSEYPSEKLKTAENVLKRYILVKSDTEVLEFVDQSDGSVILPNTGAWPHLLPRTETGKSPLLSSEKKIKYLGLEYRLEGKKRSEIPLSSPDNISKIELTPDLLIGAPHNAKVKNETRRYDESDYEYIRLTPENYSEMIAHGMNVFNVDTEQVKWIENENVYYWGVGGTDVNYPECLYTSNYIGPAIFFDEPMVHTRDQVFKPRFKEDPELRKKITPKMYFEEFKKEYHLAKYEHSPVKLLRDLDKREEVSIGDMDFLQQNIYTWETMPSSAVYQLTEGDQSTPAAMVFEPPGRLGAKRVLPELNMSFDCQIPITEPGNLLGIIKGFTRGAARYAKKDWGISIYGQVVRSDAFWQLTHAYDMGATRFFYWDSYQLAAVPYNEYLALSKNLRNYAENFPHRNLEKLKHAAEVAILIPPGYNLGHVKMGIGNFGGLPELNMERTNGYGKKYREVMNNFYIEIERCIRLGIEYDLFWKIDGLQLEGYRELVDIREDGKVEVIVDNKSEMLDSARTPERPVGDHPQLSVDLKTLNNKEYTAIANITETTAPVYYTQGAGVDGVYRNTYVLWELYGPNEEDYTDFWKERWDVVVADKEKSASAQITFHIEKSGNYRLKVSTSDIAGRSTVVWKNIHIENE